MSAAARGAAGYLYRLGLIGRKRTPAPGVPENRIPYRMTAKFDDGVLEISGSMLVPVTYKRKKLA